MTALTDRQRNSFAMVDGDGLRSADQEAGQERLPERGEACPCLQHEKEGGV